MTGIVFPEDVTVCAVPDEPLNLKFLLVPPDSVIPDAKRNARLPAPDVPSPMLSSAPDDHVNVPVYEPVPPVQSSERQEQDVFTVTFPDKSSKMTLSAAVGGPELSPPEAFTLDHVPAALQFPPAVFA